jgi:hypothetical protein
MELQHGITDGTTVWNNRWSCSADSQVELQYLRRMYAGATVHGGSTYSTMYCTVYCALQCTVHCTSYSYSGKQATAGTAQRDPPSRDSSNSQRHTSTELSSMPVRAKTTARSSHCRTAGFNLPSQHGSCGSHNYHKDPNADGRSHRPFNTRAELWNGGRRLM